MYTRPEWAAPNSEAPFELIDWVTTGTIVSHGPDGLVASHLPFMVDRQRGDNGTLVSHLARANEHAALIEAGLDCIVMFSGPHGFISSSWYPGRADEGGARNNAPTWNFAVVHGRGKPTCMTDAGTAQHIIDLVAHLEKNRPVPWSVKELGPGGMGRRMPKILGFEIEITRLTSKFKMGQDEPLADTAAAICHLARGENPALAAMMTEYNRDRR
jgi:transcriptional regulator